MDDRHKCLEEVLSTLIGLEYMDAYLPKRDNPSCGNVNLLRNFYSPHAPDWCKTAYAKLVLDHYKQMAQMFCNAMPVIKYNEQDFHVFAFDEVVWEQVRDSDSLKEFVLDLDDRYRTNQPDFIEYINKSLKEKIKMLKVEFVMLKNKSK